MFQLYTPPGSMGFCRKVPVHFRSLLQSVHQTMEVLHGNFKVRDGNPRMDL